MAPQGLQRAVTIAVGHDPAGLFSGARSRSTHQAGSQLRHPVLVRTARGQHAAVGTQHHGGRRQRLAERLYQPWNSAAQGFAGHRLLLVDDALHGAHLVGVDLVDHRPGDRDERGGRRDLEHGQAECVTRFHDSVRHLTERGSGVERERRDIGRGQPGDVVELLAVGGPDRQAGGHHQFATEEIRRGVGQLDGVRPGDGPVGVLPTGHQREPQGGVLREPPHGDRHGPL